MNVTMYKDGIYITSPQHKIDFYKKAGYEIYTPPVEVEVKKAEPKKKAQPKKTQPKKAEEK